MIWPADRVKVNRKMEAYIIAAPVYELQFLKDWSKHVANMLDIMSLKGLWRTMNRYAAYRVRSLLCALRPEALGRLPQLLYPL
jgi:hypothetical protein